MQFIPSAGIQHDGPWSGDMCNYSSLSAIHRHRTDALVYKVTVVNTFVYPVIGNSIRSPKIC